MTVTICGSMSNLPEMLRVYEELSLEGYLVYLPVILGATHKANIDEVLKEKLQQLHFKKIEESDFIFVVNPKPLRYIGEETKAEIKYAKDHLTPVKYLEDPGWELDLLEGVWKRNKEGEE